jgi:hypothetical protein
MGHWNIRRLHEALHVARIAEGSGDNNRLQGDWTQPFFVGVLAEGKAVANVFTHIHKVPSPMTQVWSVDVSEGTRITARMTEVMTVLS